MERILSLVILNRSMCLKLLEEATGLPQSTVAGRVNDLVKVNKVMYSGTMEYLGRLRKKIVPFVKAEEKQTELFA